MEGEIKMREYVVGYYNKGATKEDFVILATMDSINVAMFVRDSYNEGYERNGWDLRTEILACHEVPKNHRFANN